MMKEAIKSLIARTPYRLVRRSKLNRFSAIDEALTSLMMRGYAPSDVIDAGANVGEFAAFALTLFPDSKVHSIEPQPGCLGALNKLRKRSGDRLSVHSVALGSPEEDGKYLDLQADLNSTSTGAHISIEESGEPAIKVECVTLDRLLQGVIEPTGGALLKLDLQGYELQALRGGMGALSKCDVVLTEVSFYAQAYEPKISELVAFLAASGFELYDIASLYARPRDDRPRQGDLIFVRYRSALTDDSAWS